MVSPHAVNLQDEKHNIHSFLSLSLNAFRNGSVLQCFPYRNLVGLAPLPVSIAPPLWKIYGCISLPLEFYLTFVVNLGLPYKLGKN